MSGPLHPQLNIVIDVQDSLSELDHATRQRLLRSFDDQTAHLDAATRNKLLEAWTAPESESAKLARTEYRRAIKDSVQLLRERGIPTLWMTIGDSSELFPRTEPWPSPVPSRRPADLLHQLQLFGISPAADEDIYRKRFMSGFTTIDEIKKSPELERYIIGQRADGAAYAQAHFGSPTLSSHLKAMGVKKISIMGGNAEYCITDNAVGAALRNMRVTILPDLIVSHNTTWSRLAEHATDHAEKIKGKFKELVADPTIKGFRPIEADVLKKATEKIEFRAFPDYIRSLDVTASAKSLLSPNSVSSLSRLGLDTISKAFNSTRAGRMGKLAWMALAGGVGVGATTALNRETHVSDQPTHVNISALQNQVAPTGTTGQNMRADQSALQPKSTRPPLSNKP